MKMEDPGKNKEPLRNEAEETGQEGLRERTLRDADADETTAGGRTPRGTRLRSFFAGLWNSFSGWFLKATAPLRPPLRKAGAWFKKKFGKYISPAFLVMLFLSFIMWYMIKLSYTYVTEIPVNVNIEGHKVYVTCVAEGEGYNLFANRYYNRREINLKWSDVEVTPSAVNPRAVVISPYSLQNAISVRKPDVKIISMGTIPEVEL